MNRVLLAVATFISMIFLTKSGFADADEKDLQVNFHNNTNYDCKVIDSDTKHGDWYAGPPKSIAAHHSASWGGSQDSYYGPDMVVVLKCGRYSLRLRNRQNFSCFMGGKQYCSYTADKHLTVSYKKVQNASYGSGERGIADVTVSFNG
ncbi:hypothetical protein [Candidatus Sororendozoicomonas aggregata]|uniref:hypothetical protein n=1 Tax=Candidatus Sororendozoicomonas aggregata TaxID=3073239 RepID=UPI002ED0057D